MKLEIFEKWTKVPVSAETLWDWHMRPGAFERLAPPWQRLEPIEIPEVMRQGADVRLRLKAGPFSKEWTANIDTFEPPRRFIDTQMTGPFAQWRHEHLMEAKGKGDSVLVDRIRYVLPFKLGRLPFASGIARGQLERLFNFRHQRMVMDLTRYAGATPGKGKTVLISGVTGLIGRRLVPFLETLGYSVRGLSRRPDGVSQFAWNPDQGWIAPEALAGVNAVIHLAGENIASGQWTDGRKNLILQSRVDGTHTLVRAMQKMKNPPEVLISASGVNIYEAGSQRNDEDSPLGKTFLGEVCQRWEAEALQAQDAGIRTVCLRTGVVLDPLGGALGKMLPAFQFGLGGPVGSGEQGLPWIGMDDLLDIFEHSIREESIQGPVNAVHPEAVNQKAFSRCLGKILNRPAFLPLPESLVDVLFGEMGRETLLADLSVVPAALLANGHRFRHKNLEDTLAFILGKASV